MTRTLARQMSCPVPSPQMNGTIGFGGTSTLPLLMVIFAPFSGGVALGLAAVDMRCSPGESPGDAGEGGPANARRSTGRVPAGRPDMGYGARVTPLGAVH